MEEDPPFRFSLEAFVLGMTTALHVLTIAASVRLYAGGARRDWFCVALAVLALGGIVDSSIMAAANETAGVWSGIDVIQCAIELVCQNLLTGMNLARLRKYLSDNPAGQYAASVAPLTLAAIVSCVCGSAVSIWYIILFWGNAAPDVAGPDLFFSIYAIVDSLVNTAISVAFIRLLPRVAFSVLQRAPSMKGKPAPGGLKRKERQEVQRSIRRVRVQLAAECILVVAVNLSRVAAPDYDPQFSLVYFSEADFYVFSVEAYFTGVNSAIHASTVLLSADLLLETKSRYYAVILAIAVLRLFDIAFNVVVQTSMVDEVIIATGITQFAVEWACQVGYAALNITRLRRMYLRSAVPRHVQVLTALVGLLIVVSTVDNGWYIWCGTQLFAYLSGPDALFAAMSIYDAVLNTLISLAFVRHLHQLAHGTSSSRDQGLRRGMSALLRRVNVLLGTECVLMITANFWKVLQPKADPMWSLVLFAEAMRLRLFCSYV
ncbi:hypothetical protein H9P43_004586 [Blastocladiella emersonii ATCC 22665]|nr:hypothetical protein H9P43_004586 [Blastocladiella emersonii ATCC 22665]